MVDPAEPAVPRSGSQQNLGPLESPSFFFGRNGVSKSAFEVVEGSNRNLKKRLQHYLQWRIFFQYYLNFEMKAFYHAWLKINNSAYMARSKDVFLHRNFKGLKMSRIRNGTMVYPCSGIGWMVSILKNNFIDLDHKCIYLINYLCSFKNFINYWN